MYLDCLQMSKHIFITGTNTDVGKTYIGVRLIKELSKLGFIASVSYTHLTLPTKA